MKVAFVFLFFTQNHLNMYLQLFTVILVEGKARVELLQDQTATLEGVQMLNIQFTHVTGDLLSTTFELHVLGCMQGIFIQTAFSKEQIDNLLYDGGISTRT